jgi:microcystin-dependent protein
LTSAGTAAPTWETPAGVPVGTEALWPTNTPPTGWLQENGASLSRTGTYAALFAVIGTTYGTANGSSFNLPDSRGRFIRVWANGSALDPNAGSRTIPATAGATMTAGDNVGTNQAEDFLSHRHNVPGAIASVGTGTGGANRLTYDNGDFFTGYVGGSETRPVNTYRMMIIKY